ESNIYIIQRHFGSNYFTAFFVLIWFLRQVTVIFFTGRNWCKPFFGQFFYLIQRYITANYHNGVLRVVVFFKERFYILHPGIFNVLDIFTNSSPFVGVLFINQRTKL